MANIKAVKITSLEMQTHLFFLTEYSLPTVNKQAFAHYNWNCTYKTAEKWLHLWKAIVVRTDNNCFLAVSVIEREVLQQ